MANKKRLIHLTKKVLSIDSQNPPGNEVAIADFIAKDMKSLKFDVQTISYQKNRPNVIAVWKGSLPSKQAQEQSLLLTPHTDVVPIGHGWKYNPFGEIRGRKIYGRGASDDKGNLACAMEALRSLKEQGFVPKKDIILAATADEETGSKQGIKPLLKKGVLRPGLALVLDCLDHDTVVAQKGLLHLKIRVFGKKAHGASNWLGINAIEQAVKMIDALKKFPFQYQKHKFLNHPTVNIGTIKGGDKVNIVADYCKFTVDIRFMPSMDEKKMIKDIKKIIYGVSKNVEITIDDLQLPFEMDMKNPYVKMFLSSAKKVGVKAKLTGSNGATVISFFKAHGIPCFATGFGKTGTMHATDEYAEIKTLFDGTRLLEEFIRMYDQQ